MSCHSKRPRPILCAGIATFNGLKAARAETGDTVAVLGIGGLGHMTVQCLSLTAAALASYEHQLFRPSWYPAARFRRGIQSLHRFAPVVHDYVSIADGRGDTLVRELLL